MSTTLGNSYIQFNDGLGNPNSDIKSEPVFRSTLQIFISSATPTFTITDIRVNESFNLYFSDLRSTTTAFLRYRASTNNGVTWGGYTQISQTLNWSSSGVWGNVSRIIRQNTIVTRMTGSSFQTSTASGGNLFFNPEKLDDGFFSASTNAIEISFSSGQIAGGSTGLYNQLFMQNKKDII